jgi:DUF1009 family protein
VSPEVDTLGLIAAAGRLPRDIARAARRAGLRVAAVALHGITDPALEESVDDLQWIHVGALAALVEAFRALGVRDAVMAGKVSKTVLIDEGLKQRPDALAREAFGRLTDLRDDSILGAIADVLDANGVRLRPQAALVPELLAGEGCLGAVAPSPEGWADIAFGWPIAKTIGGLDIGQTVVVKNRAVMALEAIEGTDAAIRRGCELSGGGACVVKVAKPKQDPRFDMPTVGLDTLAALEAGNAALLAVEARATIVLDREELIAAADARGIALVGVGANGPDTESLP